MMYVLQVDGMLHQFGQEKRYKEIIKLTLDLGAKGKLPVNLDMILKAPILMMCYLGEEYGDIDGLLTFQKTGTL